MFDLGLESMVWGLYLSGTGLRIRVWVLPPLSNSWIIVIIWLYIGLTRTPNIICYWVGAVPKIGVKVLGFGLEGPEWADSLQQS